MGKVRSNKHGILYRIFINSIPIEGGGYKAKISLIKIIILSVLATIMLIVLQMAGVLQTISKVLGIVLR